MYMNTTVDRNELAKKYLPLVKKISNQMFAKCSLEYEEIEGYAWEGFVLAMNKYDSSKSDMSFKSYAAYGIRNAILNGINESSRTVSISYYNQKKLKEKGEEIPSSVSLNLHFENEDHLANLGFEDDFILEDPWKLLIEKLKNNFDKDHVDIFCATYGLDGYEIVKGKDLAIKYGVSGCLITKRLKKMIKFIKNDPELFDALQELI